MIYSTPMKDVSLDLSLSSTEDIPNGAAANFDSKGWSVYTLDGDAKTELTPNGFGGYTGLELGQTFYFSRLMTEELDSRIGHLDLPINDWFREDPIIISLPADYQGKQLTIAQSFPEWTKTGQVIAFPASVQIYCGYAYESGLISETARTMLLATPVFVLTLILLAVFVRSRDWSILCLSLTAFVL